MFPVKDALREQKVILYIHTEVKLDQNRASQAYQITAT